MEPVPHPVFVGGTGRSGTTVLAQLLGQHSAYALIPIEARFHAEETGLPGVHQGTVGLDEFRDRFLRRYYFRELENGKTRGLKVAGVPRRRAVKAIDEFVENYAADPVKSSARLMNRLFNPLAREAGARTWVEMTPPNVDYADFLQTLFPRTRLLHIVRDGRDVAASVTSKRWGPDDPYECLQWWSDRLRAADAATGDSRKVLLVGFEALMIEDRERQYSRILKFLGLEDEAGMRDYFRDECTAERAHTGRWREIVPPSEHDHFTKVYEETVQKLRADRIRSVEVLQGGAPSRLRRLVRLRG